MDGRAVAIGLAGGRAQAGQSLLHTRGSSQSGLRLYNERLALSLIRKHRSLPKAEIARLTGLSAQTVSVIVRHLEADGLLVREKPQRGKVGQPLVPFSLNPNGAFSIGLKVGRRSSDLVLLDLAGRTRNIVHRPYSFPTPARLMGFVREGIDTLLHPLKRSERNRIAGLGIAAPFELWNWQEEVGAPHEALEAWRDFDLSAEIGKLADWPIHFCNDATAACAAELLFGRGGRYRDYAYFFVGYFIGGGIALNGHVVQGRTGYAGSFGSLPVPGHGDKPQQLIGSASLYVLENRIAATGGDPMILVKEPDNWDGLGGLLDRWLDEAAEGIAYAATSVMAIIDFEAIIVDGAMPSRVRADLVKRARAALARLDLRGLPGFVIEEGSIGTDARAMGGASLPLFANFIVDRDVLFKGSL